MPKSRSKKRNPISTKKAMLQRYKLQRLVRAVKAVYYAAYWVPDRDVVGERTMWEELRDAAGFTPGKSPERITLKLDNNPTKIPAAGRLPTNAAKD
jgi:hypothetical protein